MLYKEFKTQLRSSIIALQLHTMPNAHRFGYRYLKECLKELEEMKKYEMRSMVQAVQLGAWGQKKDIDKFFRSLEGNPNGN